MRLVHLSLRDDRNARVRVLCRFAAVLLLVAALPSPSSAHGAFHDRLRELVAAIELSPADARLHFELAEIFCRHGDWALAVGSADTVDELKPGAFPTDLLRGEALLSGGKFDRAREMLDRYLANNPDSVRARLLRARVRAATEGAASALPDYRAVVRADGRPDSDEVREAAAALAAQGCADEAREAIDRALARLGPEPALLAQALALDLAVGRFEAGLGRIAALQAAAPRPEPWMIRRAEVLAQAGQTAEARRAWTAFLAHVESLPNLERGAGAMPAYVARALSALKGLPP